MVVSVCNTLLQSIIRTAVGIVTAKLAILVKNCSSAGFSLNASPEINILEYTF